MQFPTDFFLQIVAPSVAWFKVKTDVCVFILVRAWLISIRSAAYALSRGKRTFKGRGNLHTCYCTLTIFFNENKGLKYTTISSRGCLSDLLTFGTSFFTFTIPHKLYSFFFVNFDIYLIEACPSKSLKVKRLKQFRGKSTFSERTVFLSMLKLHGFTPLGVKLSQLFLMYF